jgi:HD-like signal output (HDOD) protein
MNETKKRILFVDDESMVLQGLQRMLRPMRNEWDMSFVESGAQALELMAQAPFDVVVSDMRMPGMNGAELLNEVMKRHPKTVRLILSGHADQDLILKCVGSTHQYLAKPCDAETLKSTLLRATALEASLKNERIQKLVAQIDRLPSIPAIYTQIVEKLQDPEAGLDEVGAIISRDIGMTAKILKLVNSAFFGLRREVSGPAEAVAYLGLDTVKSLVLSLHAFSQFEDVKIPGFSLPALWNHSMETASFAKGIAAAEQAEGKLRDECFVAGMLHDAGKLVLACNFTEQYGAVVRLTNEKNFTMLAAEQEVFGATHADVGGYLLGLWGLPVPVVEAIALHHAPAECPAKVFSPLTAVHVADALAHEQQAPAEVGVGSPVDASYLAELHLAGRLDVWRALLKENAAQVA